MPTLKLLIPGPVTTHRAVRAAMTRDLAPWDPDFRPLYQGLRSRLLALAGGDPATHVALTLPGCGHFAIEAAIRTLLPQGGKLLIPATGAYADRMTRLAREAGRVPIPLPVPANAPTDPAALRRALQADPGIGLVGLVYSETGTGIVHDPLAIGAAARALGRDLLVDAVSAFGALPLSLAAQPEIAAVAFTPNKCLEAMPGAAFVLARKQALIPGQAGSWAFDLADIAANEGPRFTPPVPALAALQAALDRLDAEGGPEARLARYRANLGVLYDGMLGLGLTPVLARPVQGPIVLNIHAPGDPRWDLHGFVAAAKRRGFVISNFYNTPFPSFRLGCIGALRPADMRSAVRAIAGALDDIGIQHRKAA